MKKRLIGAFIVLSVLITSLILGNNVFAIVISIIALLGLKELIDIKYLNINIIFIKVLTYILLGLFMFNNLVLKFDNKIVICASLILLILPIIFSLYSFIMGIILIIKYFNLKNITKEKNKHYLVLSIISFIIGLFLIFRPELSVYTYFKITGVYVIIVGISYFIEYINSLKKK